MSNETKRQFTTIRRVSHIEPIKGADFIEIAHIDGWQCIVVKNTFSAGDLGVYFEIGSALPVSKFERFDSFLSRTIKTLEVDGEFVKVYHIKTIKLRETLSQGLLLPLSDFNSELPKTIIEDMPLELGVLDYDGIRELMASMKGYNPNSKPKKMNFFIRILDIMIMKLFGVRLFGNGMMPRPSDVGNSSCDRIEGRLSRLRDSLGGDLGKVEVSVKYDGQAHYVWLNEDKLQQSFHNYYNANSMFNPKYFKMIKSKYTFERLIKYTEEKLNTKVALQGELVGRGINHNRHKLNDHVFILYGIYDRINCKNVDWDIINEILDDCKEWNNIKYIQNIVLDSFELSMENVRNVFSELKELAKGTSPEDTSIELPCNNIDEIEGMVIKYILSGNSGIDKLKYINPEYLMKHDD